ncbi:MAG: N-acetylmuramoyl-L-alanine amidase-like domain-containing protein [Candidatus Methylacidiphilales bacterium]
MSLLTTWFCGLPGCLAQTGVLAEEVVFVGKTRFEKLKQQAVQNRWSALALGDRTSAIGRSLVGTPYVNYTLEIHDHIEAPSVNLEGLDCWTFFEVALAFARLLDEPPDQWTPKRMLYYIELDRYRGGRCDGTYLSRLHYLEDWLVDNHRRGLVKDLTRELGGIRAPIRAREMTLGWKHYRYLKHNPSLLPELAVHEARIERLPVYYIPTARVAGMENHLKDGDIIGIWSRAPNGKISTTHVGLAIHDETGTLRFMHATTQEEYGRTVALDIRLSDYLKKFSKHAGILVARPVR